MTDYEKIRAGREKKILSLMKEGIEYTAQSLISILEKDLEISSKTIQRLLKTMTEKSLILRKKDTEATHGYLYYKEVI
jgi:predicted transcriptional regulator